MAHAAVQEALLDDERSAEVEAHLRGCTACAEFAARLAAVRTGASSVRDVVAPPAPVELADRVVVEVRAAMDGARPATWSAGRATRVEERRGALLSDAGRRSLVRSAAVAAAVLVVVGTLAVLARPEAERHDVLLASAERTEAAGSARMTVEGETELGVPVEEAPNGSAAAPRRPGTPAFDAFPAEVRAAMEAQWARTMAKFERQLSAFQAHVDDAVRRGQEQIDRALRDALGGGGGEGPGRPPEGPPAPSSLPPERQAPPSPPSRLTLRLALTADGVVGFGGRSDLQGSVRPVVPTASVEGSPAGFAVSVDGRHGALRGPDGSWTRLSSAGSPVGSLLLEPGAVARVLRNARGGVEAGATGEVEGVPVRRYRFEVDPAALMKSELSDQRWAAEASIDAAGRVRALRLQSQGGVDRTSPLTWRADVTVRLRDFGAPVADRPVGAARAGAIVAPAGRSSVLVYPFGPTVAASLATASSKSR